MKNIETEEVKKILHMVQTQTDLQCYWVKPVECFKKGYKQAIIDGVNLIEYAADYTVYSITAYR